MNPHVSVCWSVCHNFLKRQESYTSNAPIEALVMSQYDLFSFLSQTISQYCIFLDTASLKICLFLINNIKRIVKVLFLTGSCCRHNTRDTEKRKLINTCKCVPCSRCDIRTKRVREGKTEFWKKKSVKQMLVIWKYYRFVSHCICHCGRHYWAKKEG